MRRFALILLACALTALAGGSSAYAATLVTLSTESTSGTTELFGTATVACDATGTGTATYSVFGTAAGPYPGTYSETGTITFRDNVVESLDASFTIDSPAGTVSGTKHTPLRSVGTACRGSTGSPSDQTAVGGFTARYDATISSPTGTFTDHGVVSMSITLDGPNRAGFVGTNFFSDREDSTIVLSPPESVDVVGTTHTVTALVRDIETAPIAGATVLFTVAGSVSDTGSCVTDASGTCSFTYAGPSTPGSDLITACYDFDRSGTVDPGEKCTTSTKAWTAPVSTPGNVFGGGYIDSVADGRPVAFGLHARSDGTTATGGCVVVDRTLQTIVRCLDVTTLAVVGTHATFAGEATVNGVATNYRIDVDDLGEPGRDRDTFKIQTDSGYLAAGVLRAGNIVVRP